MKKIIPCGSLTSILVFALTSFAQPHTPSADVSSVDTIIKGLYKGISFKPGEMSDWNRLRMLFDPGARLIPPARPDSIIVLSFDEFASQSTQYVEQRGFKVKGFSEREIARRTEQFGNIVHVWSTYESRYKPDDPTPFSRGINSIQLMKYGGRWWIVTTMWDAERPGNQIPEKYLQRKK